MDSHIQMPKFILKQFADDKGEFYKYEVKTGYISVGTPAATNTEKDYYSKAVEEGLCKYIETPFSQKIVQKLKDEDCAVFGENEIAIMYNFAYALIARDPEMIKGIKEKSYFYRYFNEQIQHDLAVTDSIAIIDKVSKIRKEFTPTIMLNKTSHPFILPTCGMYSFSRKDTGEKFIIFPFERYKAIYFIDNNFISTFTKGGNITRATINEVEVVDYFNERAFQQQVSRKSGYVVAHSRELLEDLKSKYAKLSSDKE